MRDPEFHMQNLPLYHTEAIARDKLLLGVKYELIVSLLPKKRDDTHLYEGKVSIQFSIDTENSTK